MIINPTDALIVTDVQNDFCPGGALAVKDGDTIIPTINRLILRFNHVIFTRDWHPENHCSFANNPEFTDKSWPKHCVAYSPGAEFHGDLLVSSDALVISKGTEPDVEAYSAFSGTPLAVELAKRGITRVFVCGLTTDYCVKETSLDAVKLGFSAYFVNDACCGVDVPRGSAAEAVETMRAAGVCICTSGDLV